MRILLADDHAVVRRGLQMVLSLEPDFIIVGEASSSAEAVALAERLRPDLVLMDLKMPGLDGASATRAIKQSRPETRVLILTGVTVDEQIARALEAGADGYVLKEISPEELVHAIRMVGAGESFLQPSVTKQLIRKMHTAAESPDSIPKHPPLTPRESQVLQLMATSATYREIAAQLVIGEETVRSHTKSILTKLGQPNRTLAVLVALKEGLVSLE
jgi:DNA-binding NarL/FixJ family response regulator